MIRPFAGPRRWHIYPEMAAAGLWTTPTDLLLWAMEVAAAYDGRSERVLSGELAIEMLNAQQAISGLGPFVRGNRGAWYFEHGGVNDGFVSQVIYFPDTEQGAAVMTNGDTGILSLSREILFSIAAEYSWPSFSNVTPMLLAADDLPAYIGEYIVTGANPLTMSIIEDHGRLHTRAIDWTPAFAPIGLLPSEEIVLIAPQAAIGLISGAEYAFDPGGSDSISQLNAFGLTFRKQ